MVYIQFDGLELLEESIEFACDSAALRSTIICILAVSTENRKKLLNTVHRLVEWTFFLGGVT